MDTDVEQATTPAIRTIGHSSHELDKFLGLLAQHRIEVLADVRSAPYSRFSPQFNRQDLEKALPAHGIRYRFLGAKLGGRPEDPRCYDESGHVIYDRMEETADYRAGIDEVLAHALRGDVICLMCSEEDPAICHRALSVGHFLTEREVRVEHIRGDGRVELQEELHGKAINQPIQFNLFEEQPLRKSLQPVSPVRPQSNSSES